ncbi:MAG: phytoene desaturase, partial [Bacteroidota bacterium]
NGRAEGVVTSDGELLGADAVVVNADAEYARTELLPEEGRRKPPDPSLSGFVLLAGSARCFPDLAHHNVFFPEDYEREFREILLDGKPCREPAVYVSLSARTVPSHAPPGCSNLFVLVNAPPLPERRKEGAWAWEKEAPAYGEHLLRVLESRGLAGAGEGIGLRRTITPPDLASEFNAWRGTIYGGSSNSRRAAFLRSPNRSPRTANLYYAGGSAHPGGGVPMVMLSGRIASGLLMKDCPP